MYKVTLNITEDRYTWAVWGGPLRVFVAAYTMVRDECGAKGVEPYEPFEKALIERGLENVVDAIEDADPYRIMEYLNEFTQD